MVEESANSQGVPSAKKVETGYATLTLDLIASVFHGNNIAADISLVNCESCALHYDDYGNATLDLSSVQHLDYLKLEVVKNNLDVKSYRCVYVKFELANGVLCYKCVKLPQEEWTQQQYGLRREKQLYRFEKVASSFIGKYNRTTSRHTTVITIKCGSIDNFTLKAAYKSSSYTHTLNLTLTGARVAEEPAM